VSTGEAAGATPWDEVVKGQPDDFHAADVDENEMAVLLYTSGTTGTPKGVMLSGNNIYFDALAAVRTNNVARGEVALSALPMSHAYGLTTAFASMIAGTRGILQRWFNAAEVLDLTERFGVNTVVGVPAMYALLCREPDAAKRNVSSWKRLQAGGAPCPADLHELFEKTFNISLLEGYGLSEAAPIVSANRPGESKRGSVGKPLDGIQVAAMDDGGRPLPAMETGEICVKGPNVMLGYYKMPGETSRAFLDGWLRTGDVGYVDRDGFIYILERKKDMIIRGGFNVLPAEVEEVLLSHPAVGEAAVVGVPDEVYGEEIKAFVVLRQGASVSGPEIMEYAKGFLAAYKRPRSVEFLDRLPRNVLGKVLKKDLPRS
jgi:long-chain acyl-CoA synthetase